MDNSERIEAALEAAIRAQEGASGPPRLAAAIRHAVFPGGARIRPHLCLAVAQACGADDLGLAAAAGAAIELLHCASLVHDDLPCFDNAATRRGRPSVFAAHGERLAVLAGDALIVTAYQSVAAAAATRPERLVALIKTISEGVGAPSGIVANVSASVSSAPFVSESAAVTSTPSVWNAPRIAAADSLLPFAASLMFTERNLKPLPSPSTEVPVACAARLNCESVEPATPIFWERSSSEPARSVLWCIP